MPKWTKFNVEAPPANWCMLRIEGQLGETLGKWSRSNYCWINMSLTPLVGYKFVDEYLETDYATLNDMIYNVRAKKPEPKVYDQENDNLKKLFDKST